MNLYLPRREITHTPLCLMGHTEMVKYMCSFSSHAGHIILIYSSCQKTRLSFLFSARAGEPSRAHCHFPRGGFRVRRQRVSRLYVGFVIKSIQLCFHWSSPFSLRCVFLKSTETHQTSGDDGPPVMKRQKPSPGPFIIIKDESDDDLSYVRRHFSF